MRESKYIPLIKDNIILIHDCINFQICHHLIEMCFDILFFDNYEQVLTFHLQKKGDVVLLNIDTDYSYMYTALHQQPLISTGYAGQSYN